MTHKLEADSILLEFGLRKILTDVYLICETGKITGLLGRNGEGKSCLMNIICGSLEPTSKSVRFDNTNVPYPYKNPDLLLYLPQFNFVPKSLTVKRVFNDFSVDFAEFEKEFPDIKLTSKIKHLSGGQIRLVELYAILKSKTQFVMLDEPFTHIMPLHIEKIKEIMIVEKHNKGILVTDHVYKHIIDMSDQLYILTNGKTHLTKNTADIEKLGYARI
ncbi:MAG TPA: ATP-binding cassette domain-containing protein [Bacteroidia bacterium]|jgi:ABC-type lipopolysaccharide export system ATPase subunit|nr:ATP-binding cassette domain-containing protein [Bacteroidia bacterium]